MNGQISFLKSRALRVWNNVAIIDNMRSRHKIIFAEKLSMSDYENGISTADTLVIEVARLNY